MNCKICGLEEGRLNVVLEQDGSCNYCMHWQRNKARFTDYTRLQPLLLERIAETRGKYAYDALVGFSGGKDSTYVINSLRRTHGLRVLAITFDNGFLTDWARKNIERTLGVLEIEHVYHRPNWKLHSLLYRAALDTYGDPCVACAIPLYFYTIKHAFEKRIPLIVHGRSPFQIFRNFYPGSADVFLELHESNYEPLSLPKLADIYRRFNKHVLSWLTEMFPKDDRLRMDIYDEFFPNTDTLDLSFAPDFVGLFQYQPYDEEQIKREMGKSVGYERPANDRLLGHGDCKIHDASAYIFRRIHRGSVIEVEVAAMVRHGLMTLEQGALHLSHNATLEEALPADSMDTLVTAVGMQPEELEPRIVSLCSRVRNKFPCH